MVLTVDHAFDPIEGMEAQLEAVSLDTDQMEAPYSTFRVSLNTPWLDSKYFFDNATTDGDTISETATSCDAPYYIPFCLPPLQDDWPATDSARVSPGQSIPVLEEISFSFDQADEPAAIMSQWFGKKTSTTKVTSAATTAPAGPATYGGYQLKSSTDPFPNDWCPNPYEGKKSYDRTDAYDFRLVIYEKEQFAWNDLGTNTMTPMEMSRDLKEVVSISYPATNFIGTIAKFNPDTVTGINRQFSPFKTYVAALFAPRLHDFDANRRQHAALVNVWIGLKFKAKRVQRDIGSAASSPPVVQNIPTQANYSGRLAESITITKPVAGDLVSADVLPSGINTNLQKIDQVFHDKIRGGYSTQSMTYPEEQIAQDAGYDVIAVPLGQGFPFNRMGARDDFPLAPYTYNNGTNFIQTTATPPVAADYGTNGEKAYLDRRVIPIVEPFTLHHVIFGMNHTSDRVPVSWNHVNDGSVTDVPNWLNATQPAGQQSPGVGSVAVTVLGAGYAAGTTVATTATSGSGTGLTIRVTSVDGAGGITGYAVAFPGYGYVNGDTVTVDGGAPLAQATVTVNARSAIYSVGVGMVSGPGGDDTEYQQLAYRSITNGGISPASATVPKDFFIDGVNMDLPALQSATDTAEYKLVNVPLVGAGGKGYTAGGTPVFIGQSNTYREQRKGVSDVPGLPVYSDAFDGKPGMERYLEVRLEVDPEYPVHKVDPTTPADVEFGGNYNQQDIFIGYGGCWVYLIGKKHLT
ncbi:MAG: hypothetical protein Unbinned3620contig1001_12 [Prokaryotic dsDNA virus sp.]|nr:MAG: hypothetical protein Unbinned3620contig1001_12 [Prokaryotic dsDNA virus sp.]